MTPGKQGGSQRLREEIDDRLAFLGAFLRRPARVGSVVPSSRFAERRILDLAQVELAGSVVELGSGTGGTTRAILAAMPARARLLSIEIDPRLHALLRRIRDPRLFAHLGSAEDLGAVLAAHGMGPVDAVISGIPFSTLGRTRAERVLAEIARALAPGGRFVAYQVTGAVERLARPFFGEPYGELELLNIPPVRVFRWVKTAREGAGVTKR
jgi:phospholipid N-methyltransferase